MQQLLTLVDKCVYVVYAYFGWANVVIYTAYMPTPRPVDSKPERVFKIPVPVDEKPDWKSKIPVPVNKNRTLAQEIRFRFVKTLFRSSPSDLVRVLTRVFIVFI